MKPMSNKNFNKTANVRNWHALNALSRRASTFKHKTAPKGGSRNWRSLKEAE
jgi:hypothetical protein